MRVIFCFLLVIAGFAGGCTSDKQSSSDSTDSASSTDVTVVTYEGQGLVKSVLPNRKYVVVDHGDIEGYMSAMEMPFALKDTSVAAGVAAGDSILFTIEVEGPNIRMSRIEILP